MLRANIPLARAWCIFSIDGTVVQPTGFWSPHPFRDELFILTLLGPSCFDHAWSTDTMPHARAYARMLSPRIAVGGDDAHPLRKTKFDGTKLPLVVLALQTTTRCIVAPFPRLISPPESSRGDPQNRPTISGDATVGDKIELTVTIVAREHHYHGR